jgi:hypothetical protein
MMGSYERNDENYSDPLAGSDQPGQLQMACPIEPDYWGIRKAFWWNTDQTFRSAARSYRNKLQAISEFPLDDETAKLPDYTPAEPVRIFLADSVAKPDSKQLERLAKEISSVFRDSPVLRQSGASVIALVAKVYIVNSEGTALIIPLNLCMVNIHGQIRTDEEEMLGENLSFIASSVEALPPLDTMKQAALMLGQYLQDIALADENREEYQGPVLLLNQASSGAFLSGLFGEVNPLIASREPLVYNAKKSMVPNDRVSIENRLDKRIIAPGLTVTVNPSLESYQGMPLLGNLKVDAEGIIPPDELVLVQDGVLKNLLSNRVPTPRIRQSNGHNRIGIRMGGFSFQDAPSVLKVTSALSYSHSELYGILTGLAREKGLDYAFVIRPLVRTASYSPWCFYRIDLKTGTEQLVSAHIPGDIDLNHLNKRLYVSGQNYITNTLFGSYSLTGGAFFDGVPVSLIVPDALLLEEMTLRPE